MKPLRRAVYLHNRIETLAKKAAALQRMFPDARIAVGHGRLDEAETAGL